MQAVSLEKLVRADVADCVIRARLRMEQRAREFRALCEPIARPPSHAERIRAELKRIKAHREASHV